MRLLFVLLIAFAICGSVWSQSCNASDSTCGNGMKGDSEECDDGDLVSGDGCSDTCSIETGFNCTTNSPCLTTCNFVYLLDLNASDGIDNLDHSDLILYSTSSYLIDDDSYSYALINNSRWDNISVVIMDNGDGSNNGEYIDLQISRAVADNRLSNGSLVDDVTRDEIDVSSSIASALEGILGPGEKIFRGSIYTPKNSIDGPNFVNVTLKSLRYIYENTTNFVPRRICIIPQYNEFHSVSCINVTFVGTNSDPPQLTYTEAAVMPRFTEGQSTPTVVFNGVLEVTDPNHPMYLMQQATVTIFGGQPEHEVLNLTGTFPSLKSSYDAERTQLTITGNATTEVYQRAITSVTYFNSNEEPNQLTRIRTIGVSLFDGQGFDEIENDLLLINRNDVPTIIFSSSNLTLYYERNRSVVVDPELMVVDADPNEMIQSVEIDILEPNDAENEIITVTSSYPQVNVASDIRPLVLSGNATPAVYQDILRTVRYEHNDTFPGNPTPGIRTIQFYIQDDQSLAGTLNLSFTIVPINDAPVMSYNDLTFTKTLRYQEDDPPLSLFNDLYLRDVDSDLSNATLQFTGLLNGLNDNFTVNQTLVSSYGLQVVITSQSSYSRTILITGNASPDQYSEVLKSLAYQSLLQDNTVTDGTRNISLQVSDVYGLTSPTVRILLEVNERNDEPNVRIDEIIEFVEGQESVNIITSYLINIMDEELNNISSINITLVGTNGQLDPKELIFVRPTIDTPLLIDKATETNTSIYIPCEGTVTQYEEVLRAIYYINYEDEPTYYVNATSREKLRREIIVELTDDNVTHPSTARHRILVNITLINDNIPTITLKLANSSCFTNYPGNFTNKRSVRSITNTAPTFLHKRLQIKRKAKTIIGMSPSVEMAFSQVTQLVDNITCLANITIIFNTNTTTPLVEVRGDLQDILSLYPSDLNQLPHYGKWMNKRTLLINFMGCNQMTNKDVHVVFKGQKDRCNGSSSCNLGICFANQTGCPVTGFHPVINNSTVTQVGINITTSLPPTYQTSPRLVPYFLLFIMLALTLLVLIVGAKIMYCMEKPARKTSLKNNIILLDTAKQKPPETLQPSEVTQSKVTTTETATTTTQPKVVSENTTDAKLTPSSISNSSELKDKTNATSQKTTASRQLPQVAASSQEESSVHHIATKTDNSNNYQLVKLPKH